MRRARGAAAQRAKYTNLKNDPGTWVILASAYMNAFLYDLMKDSESKLGAKIKVCKEEPRMFL